VRGLETSGPMARRKRPLSDPAINRLIPKVL
jgi:hypothetical protein